MIKCEWATELGNCNLIFGLGGANKDKSLKEQSVMYQFAHYAKMGGAKIYGTIPFGQVAWEEKLDFSIGIESCYITPQLQERMDAFKNLSQFIIVGSTGTGTYEEIIDTLRTNPLTHIMIMNDDGGNTPLLTLLNANKDKYSNVTVATNRSEFKAIIDNFKRPFIEHNVAELLISAYRNNNDDLYESNLPSVATSSDAFFSSSLEGIKTESVKLNQGTDSFKLGIK